MSSSPVFSPFVMLQMTAQTKDSVDDVDLYLEHANNSVHMLLVTNYEEMEDEVDGVLANLTERVDAVVGGLENVRQTLEEVSEDIGELEMKKNQLKTGLEEEKACSQGKQGGKRPVQAKPLPGPHPSVIQAVSFMPRHV